MIVLVHIMSSHLCNKREVTLTKFEKFYPPQNKSPPSTPCLLELCTSFFQKIPSSTFIPTSTFIDFATFAPPPRLLQPPR